MSSLNLVYTRDGYKQLAEHPLLEMEKEIKLLDKFKDKRITMDE